jgi:hypothetical protein
MNLNFSINKIFLKVNTTLTSLSLADNSIGKGGGMAFAETLQINITLEHLNLGNCDLVCHSIPFNISLKIIRI